MNVLFEKLPSGAILVTREELKRIKQGIFLIVNSESDRYFLSRFNKFCDTCHPVNAFIGDPNGKGWDKDERTLNWKRAFWPAGVNKEDFMETK